MASNLGVFLSELKRRKVYRVAVAYIVVGIGVLGAAEVIMDPLGLEGARPIIVLLTLLGFPLAVVLAWAYEVRPEEPRLVDPPGEKTGSTGETLATAEPATVEPATAAQPRSIAVLAFANLSADPENEYFCDGISEEIINALAHLPELKVAGRTSAFSFKGTDLDVPEIGTKLKVATVLEGSVRKMR